MKLIRLFFWFLLACGCVIAGSVSVTTLYNPPVQASPVPEVATKARPLSALRLNPKRLSRTLDRQNVAAAIRQVELGWKNQYETYYQGGLTSQVLSADEIARSLSEIAQQTGQSSALLYAIPTPNHLELMLIAPGQEPVHRRITEANLAQLTNTIQQYRRGVVNVRLPSSAYLPAAQQLYQWLIAPFESELQQNQIDTLIFCLGSKLRSLPIAALHDGQQFLIEKYSLAIIPAFNLLDRRPSQLTDAKVLAMGASEFPQENPLPAVPVELSAITQLWQGETWLNQTFTLDNLKARRAVYPFSVIHLATHATFAPGSVANSYIQFWDQSLSLDRLRELNLQSPDVQLLVLSACRTAMGDTNAELGFAGLAVQSGAKAALASLWSVSDAGTLVLMVDFYQRLKTAPIKAEALRQAQLGMLQGRLRLDSGPVERAIGNQPLPDELQEFTSVDLSHPYYWAAFTMIGNPW